MGSNISGTYFTSVEYDIPNKKYNLGPIVVVDTSNNSVVVDGVTIKSPMVTATQVIWMDSAGNPSSGLLTFAESDSIMTFFGMYYLSGSAQPSANNIFGFNSQPDSPISTWNGTYYTTQKTGGTSTSLDNIVVSGDTITFGSVTIKNPIYTGYQQSNELAWFTSDGNGNNVAISFTASTTQTGVLLFWGWIWQDGSTRPPEDQTNFFGTTDSDKNAADVAKDVGEAVGAVVGIAGLGYKAYKAAKAAREEGQAEAGEEEAAGDDAAAGEDAAQEGAEAGQEAGEEAAAGEGEAEAATEEAAEEAAEGTAEEIAETAADFLEGAAEGAAADAVMGVPKHHNRPAKAKLPKAKSGLSAKDLLRLKRR